MSDAPLTVLVDATMLDGGPSGAATRLSALAEAFARRRDVALVHLVRPGVDPLPGHACLPFAGADTPLGRARAGRRLLAAARACGAGVLHAGALPLPSIAGLPLTLTLHDLRLLDDPGAQPLLRRAWTALRLRSHLARAAAVVAVSQTTAAGLLARGLLPPERVVVAGNAGTPGLARVGDPARLAAFRRRAGLNSRFVLALGPVVRHKRPGFLLEVLAAVRGAAEGRDVALAFAGRVEPEAALALARKAERLGLLGAVAVLGPLDDAALAEAFSAADALVVASRVEGFSIPVVDAGRLGVPVAAVSAGALPEVAGEEAAWLAPAGEAASLASAVLGALRDGPERERRLVAAARRAAERSWDASADVLAALWQRVAGGARG